MSALSVEAISIDVGRRNVRGMLVCGCLAKAPDDPAVFHIFEFDETPGADELGGRHLLLRPVLAGCQIKAQLFGKREPVV